MRDQAKNLLARMDRQMESSDERLITSAAGARVTNNYLTTSREAIDRSRRQIARTITSLGASGA